MPGRGANTRVNYIYELEHRVRVARQRLLVVVARRELRRITGAVRARGGDSYNYFN